MKIKNNQTNSYLLTKVVAIWFKSGYHKHYCLKMLNKKIILFRN